MTDVEELRAFEEERPLFRKPGLECGEIHFGRVSFHLAKVGIDRRFEREIRPEPHLQIGAGPAPEILAVIKWIASIAVVADRGRTRDVRHGFDAPGGANVGDAIEIAKA